MGIGLPEAFDDMVDEGSLGERYGVGWSVMADGNSQCKLSGAQLGNVSVGLEKIPEPVVFLW